MFNLLDSEVIWYLWKVVNFAIGDDENGLTKHFLYQECPDYEIEEGGVLYDLQFDILV